MDDKRKQPTSEQPKQNEAEPADTESTEKDPDPLGLDPTRFGDWEKNGRCIDF
jgi:hypothetical protein